MSTRTTPDHWDEETDFLSIGAGIGGLAGAIAASAWGLDSIVIEKGPTVGGVTAFSGGQLWVPANHFQEAEGIEDSLEDGYEYIAATGGGLHDPHLARNYLVHAPLALRWFADQAGVPFSVIPDFPDYYYPKAPASRANGRYIESAPFDANALGEWRSLTHLSPQMNSGLTMAEAVEHGGNMAFAKWDRTLFDDRREKDIRTYGPGLGAGFVKAALDRDISILVGTAAEELIAEDGRVLGVRAQRDGRDFFIRARHGVLIAAGGYDWNAEAQKFFGMIPDIRAAGPASVTGDAIRMAGMLGAQIAQVPQPVNAGFGIEGEEHEGVPLWRLGAGVIGVPHAIAVNRKGRRFAEESFYRSVGFALKKIDGATMEYENYPFWAIQDSQARERYAIGPYGAGEDLPAHLAIRADSIRELAELAGIDPDGLESEIERFNTFVRDGVDADFHRGERPWSALSFGDITIKGNSNLGAIERGPFYAVKMIPLNIGISNVGLAGDEHSRVIDWNGDPIDGLYVAGNSMALTEFGAGYTSGQANTRGMLGGYLAARHAAGDPSTALADYEGQASK
ncbi:FAD-binding protein [Microbacterium sp. NPDC077644]|uniref:FAD-binding protein n=1 Tax=Microbacterium sp. NPDC077644 TaxID=3155055 RepID=UPI00344D29C0